MAIFGVPVMVKRSYRLYVNAESEREAAEKAKVEATNPDNLINDDEDIDIEEQDVEVAEPYYLCEDDDDEDEEPVQYVLESTTKLVSPKCRYCDKYMGDDEYITKDYRYWAYFYCSCGARSPIAYGNTKQEAINNAYAAATKGSAANDRQT